MLTEHASDSDSQQVATALEIASQPAHQDSDPGDAVMHWLLHEGWGLTSPQELVRQIAEQLIDAGLPIWRMRLTIRYLHPQLIGSSYTWVEDTPEVEEHLAPHGIQDTEAYTNSPYAPIFDDGEMEIRRRLEVPDDQLDFPVLHDLKEQGATDYTARGVVFQDGRRSAITVATKRPGGFPDPGMAVLDKIMPMLSRVIETMALRHTAQSLLDTYLGRQTGRKVLEGQIKRGDGETIESIIWFCDLRDSTPLAKELGQEAFLALLNEFFGIMAESVLDNEGEVLRYIGDAVLAIFPLPVNYCPQCEKTQTAATAAANALNDAMARMTAWNAEREAKGLRPVSFGIGLHVGQVMYGNIGAPSRLEFSVIGSAANEAARLESLTKTLQEPALVSDSFVALHGGKDWRGLGQHALKGLEAPMAVWGLPQKAA